MSGIDFEIEVWIQDVQPKVLAYMADMLLEETKTLRCVGSFYRSTGGS